jgi:hypothetical protein
MDRQAALTGPCAGARQVHADQRPSDGRARDFAYCVLAGILPWRDRA